MPKHYIFITTEGHTFQPQSESPDPDVENCQVLATGTGKDAEDAWNRAAGGDHAFLLETSFDELICYELANHGEVAGRFSLEQTREEQEISFRDWLNRQFDRMAVQATVEELAEFAFEGGIEEARQEYQNIQ